MDFEEDVVVLGRGLGCDLVVDEGHISNVHARVFWNKGLVWFEDLGSVNGSLVNGRRIIDPVVLRSGDVIQLGPKMKIQFSLVSEKGFQNTLPDSRGIQPVLERQRAVQSARQAAVPIWIMIIIGLLILFCLAIILAGGGIVLLNGNVLF